MSQNNLSNIVAVTAGLAIGLTGAYATEHDINPEQTALAAGVIGANATAAYVSYNSLKNEEDEE